MAKDAITTKFSLDVTEFKRNITEANKQIKLANAEFKAASAGMDDWSKSSDGITAKLDQLDKTLTAQKSILESYKAQLQAQQSAYDENGKKAEELKAKLAELAKDGISKTSEEYKKYVSALSDVEKEQGKNQAAIDKLNVQILNQEAAVKTTEKETNKYKDTLVDVQKAEDKAAKSGRSVEEELKDVGDSAEKADGKLGSLAKGITTGIVAGLAALATAAIAAGKEIINLASDVAKAGDEIDKESQKLGMSAENYQKLSYAMERSGASIDELRKGTVNITKVLKEAADQEKALGDTTVEEMEKAKQAQLDALSVQYDSAKKSFDDALQAQKDTYDKRYDQLSKDLDREIDAVQEANEAQLEALKDTQDKEVEALQKATEAKIALIDEEYKESLKNIDKEEYERLKAIDAQIDAINAQSEAEAEAREKREQNEKKDSLRAAISSAKTADERAKAQKAYDKYVEDLEQKRRDKERKRQVENLKEEKDAIKEEAKAQKEAAKEKHDEAVEQVKEEGKEQLEELKKAQAEQTKVLKKEQQAQIEAMKEARSERLDLLKKEQNEQLEILKESQDKQLEVLKKSNEEQKKEIENMGKVTESTKLNVKLFDDLGVSLQDANGKLRTTDDVLLDTIEALANMEDDVQRDIVANQIFGKTFTEMRPLINGGADSIRELMQEAEDYGMVMSDDAVAASAEFEDSLLKVQGTLGGLKNRLGAELLPALTDIMDGFSDFVAGVDGGDKKVADGINSLIQGIKKVFPEIGRFIGSVKDAFAKEVPGILKNLASELLKALPQAADTLVGIINELLSLAMDMLPGIVDTVSALIIQISNSLSSVLPPLLQKLVTEVIPTVTKSILSAAPDLLQASIDFFLSMVDAIPELIRALNEALPGLIDDISKALIKATPILIDGSIKLFMAITEVLPEILPELAKMTLKMVESAAKLLIDNVPVLLDGAVKLYMALADGIRKVIPALGQALLETLDVFETEFGQPLREMWESGWETLKEGAANAYKAVTEIFGGLANFFGDKFSEAWERVKKVFSTGSEVFNNITDGINEAFKAVVNLLIDGLNMAIAQPFEQLNELLNIIRSIDILGIKPFEGLWDENPFLVPEIPHLAQGGVLRRGQVGLLEGDGAEAVVPLERNKAWIRSVAADMLKTLNESGAGTAIGNMSRNVSFVQNNYSPKALSRLEIYRQTRNLTAMMRGV